MSVSRCCKARRGTDASIYAAIAAIWTGSLLLGSNDGLQPPYAASLQRRQSVGLCTQAAITQH